MKNILLVDDLGIDVMLTRLALQEFAFDHQLVVASDGAEAFEIMRAQRFDLLLLDIKMPQVDGFELLARLRAESLAGMPVIVVSGSGLAADRERAQHDRDVEPARGHSSWSASKQVVSPVWQAGPVWSTSTSSVSPSQSSRTSRTAWVWPDVSPLTQYAWRLRLQ